MVHSAPRVRLHHALLPDAGDKVLAAIDDVTVGSVRNFVKRLLGRQHRAVVITVPASSPASPP
jgi:hypothetical protein